MLYVFTESMYSNNSGRMIARNPWEIEIQVIEKPMTNNSILKYL